MEENNGKVPCPYCEEELKKEEELRKKYPTNGSSGNWRTYHCIYCYDKKLINWVDAIIKPTWEHFGTSGTSGVSGSSGVSGVSGVQGSNGITSNIPFPSLPNVIIKEVASKKGSLYERIKQKWRSPMPVL